MIPNKPNTDPNKRFFCATVVSQKESIASKWVYHVTTRKIIQKQILEGNRSETLDMIFDAPDTINSSVLICIYEQPDGSFRRRIALHPKLPDNPEELKNWMLELMETLGITAKIHTFENESAKISKLNKISRVVREKKVFLDELIEMTKGKIKYDNLDSQLAEIAEDILRSTSLGLSYSDAAGYVLGYFLQTYLDTKDNVYQIADKFGRHLAKTTIKIPTEYLDVTTPILFQFPLSFKISKTQYVKNAICSSASDPNGKPGILIIAPIYNDGMWDGNFVECIWYVKDNKVIEDIPSEFKNLTSDHSTVDLKEFLLYCLKCIMYIHSAEPELKTVPAAKCTKKNPSKLRKFYKDNCPYNIINVGYAFHGVTYNVDEVTVTGHFRLQPCGVGRTEVKLIWIDEHLRHYNKSLK